MVKTFRSVERARAYAKKVGGWVYNYPKGYSNRKIGHLIVKKSKEKKRINKRMRR